MHLCKCTGRRHVPSRQNEQQPPYGKEQQTEAPGSHATIRSQNPRGLKYLSELCLTAKLGQSSLESYKVLGTSGNRTTFCQAALFIHVAPDQGILLHLLRREVPVEEFTSEAFSN